MQVEKQQLEPNMEQWTVFKYKSMTRLSLTAYLTSIQSTSCKMLGWMNHKLESRLFGEIKIKQKKKKHRNLRYANNIALMAESGEEVKSLLMRVKEEREKAGLKLNIQ